MGQHDFSRTARPLFPPFFPRVSVSSVLNFQLSFSAYDATLFPMTPVEPNRMSPPVRRESDPTSLPPPTTDDIHPPGSTSVSDVPFGVPPKVSTPSIHRPRFSPCPPPLPPSFEVRQPSAAFRPVRLPCRLPLQTAPLAPEPCRPPKPAPSTRASHPQPGNFPLKTPAIPLFPVNPTSKILPSRPCSSPPFPLLSFLSAIPCPSLCPLCLSGENGESANKAEYPSNPGLSHLSASHQSTFPPQNHSAPCAPAFLVIPFAIPLALPIRPFPFPFLLSILRLFAATLPLVNIRPKRSKSAKPPSPTPRLCANLRQLALNSEKFLLSFPALVFGEKWRKCNISPLFTTSLFIANYSPSKLNEFSHQSSLHIFRGSPLLSPCPPPPGLGLL